MLIRKWTGLVLRTLPFLLLLSAVSCSTLGFSFKGEVVDALPAPDFSLSDQYGKPFQLSGQRGRIVLLFFGFTNCVDECPLTLAHLKLALESLGASADQVQVVMVTTDPVRDSRKTLMDFLDNFDTEFLGITGSMDEVSKVWGDYGVTVLDGGETHSTSIHVIDQSGRLRILFDPEMPPEDMASDLKVLLAED